MFWELTGSFLHKRKVKLIGVATVALTFMTVTAQSPELTPQQIVEKAFESSGGETWVKPKTLQLRGTAVFYWQGEKKEELKVDNYKMWRVFPSDNKSAHQANGRVRFDAFRGDKLYFQIAFDGKESSSQYSKEAEHTRESARWENNFGFSILRYVRNPGFELTRLADDQVEGHECYFIRVIDPSKQVTDFGIDKKDYAIRYVGFRTPRGFHHRIYSDFKWNKSPRFRQPGRVRLYYDGVKWTDILWKEFEINKPIADEVFTLKDKAQSTSGK